MSSRTLKAIHLFAFCFALFALVHLLRIQILSFRLIRLFLSVVRFNLFTSCSLSLSHFSSHKTICSRLSSAHFSSPSSPPSSSSACSMASDSTGALLVPITLYCQMLNTACSPFIFSSYAYKCTCFLLPRPSLPPLLSPIHVLPLSSRSRLLSSACFLRSLSLFLLPQKTLDPLQSARFSPFRLKDSQLASNWLHFSSFTSFL
jgi:hypothetical protein